MGENISVKITLDDKFSSGMKNMTEHIKKFNNEIISLSADLDKLSKKKIELNINTDKFNKNLKNTASDVMGLNSAIDDLFEVKSNEQSNIINTLKEICEQAKNATKGLNDTKTAASKLDNDIDSRESKGTDDKSKAVKTFGNMIKDPIVDIASLYLPESISKGLNGAIEGALAGFEVGGPIGAVAGGIISGVGNYASSEQQQKVDKQTQRIQFGSSLIQQYLPQLAMGSINYGSRMEQTKLQFDKNPGINDSQKMIDDLQKISLKSSLDFFELAEKAQEMLSDQSNKLNQDEVIASLKAMEQEATTFDSLISNIKEGASQLILGPLGSGFIEGIKPALDRFVEFFGIGTKGFADLKDDIFGFGKGIGMHLRGVIDSINGALSGLFNSNDFQKASVPEKFLKVLEELQNQANKWLSKGGGKGIIESVKTYFKAIFTALAADDDFMKSIQDLWITISPNSDTVKEILKKAINWDDDKSTTENIFNLFKNSDNNLDSSSSIQSSNGAQSNKLIRNPVLDIIEGKKMDFGITQAPYESPKAFGIDRVPYDGYRAVLHEGERVLTRVQTDNQTGSISINKIADTVIVREESDIDKITQNLIAKLESYRLAYGGVM